LTRRRDETGGLTESGQFVGTLDYVAPEQIESRPVSGAIDVYALSCVLFECLTGEPPFRGDSNVGLMLAHLQTEPPRASEANSDLPERLDPVLARGMAKAPDARHPTCRELVESARAALDVSGEGATLAAPPSRGRRRLLLMAALAAAGIAVAAVLAAVLLTGGDDVAVGDVWTRVPGSAAVVSGTHASQEMTAVTRLDNGFIAIGSDDSGQTMDGAIWLSSEGLEWSRVTDSGRELGGAHDQSIPDADQGSSSVVAVGSEGFPAPDGGRSVAGAAWVSVDGSSWSRVDVPMVCPDVEPEEFLPLDRLRAVVAAGPGFVAVGSGSCSGPTVVATDAGGGGATDAGVWTSVDGTSWERVDPQHHGLTNQFFQGMDDVTVRDGTLVAVGWTEETPNAVQPMAWVSRDGVAWARAPDQSAFESRIWACMNSVAATRDGYVAVGAASDEGVLIGDAGGGSPCLPDPESERGLSELDAAAWHSEDGLNWSEASFEPALEPSDVEAMSSVAVVGDTLVAVGWSGRLPADRDVSVWVSSDGKQWREVTDSTETLSRLDLQEANGVASTGSGAVAVGIAGRLSRSTPPSGHRPDAHVTLARYGGSPVSRQCAAGLRLEQGADATPGLLHSGRR
jgi:hypothetical protein